MDDRNILLSQHPNRRSYRDYKCTRKSLLILLAALLLALAITGVTLFVLKYDNGHSDSTTMDPSSTPYPETTTASVDAEKELFKNYIKKYNPDPDYYLDKSHNFSADKETFLKHYYKIEEHNAGNSFYELKINEFAHLTYEEFLKQKTGHIYRDRSGAPTEQPKKETTEAPESHDWRRTANVIKDVQDQGQCGSCWAFAGIAALEGQMNLLKGANEKLSEQEIIECVKNGNVLLGCNGGWDIPLYNHAKVNGGVTSLALDPYVAKTNGRICRIDDRARASGSAVANWFIAPQDEGTIKEWLFSYGPLYIIFHVSDDFMLYKKGIYTDTKNQCADQNPNHAVLLIGYGIENGVEFWILKNSWGSRWGEKGFFRMKRNAKLCGIELNASFPGLV